MSTATVSDGAVKAAEWWAEQVGAPTFRNVDANSGPDDQRLGTFAGFFGSLIADRHPVSKEQGARFVEALAPRIQKIMDRGYGMGLGVDYGPDPELADAADAAGIHLSRFPWKTTMWAKPDHISVSAGYRGRQVLVWASDDWLANRPVCDSQKWDETRQDREYHGESLACSLPIYHEEGHRYDRPIELCRLCGHRKGWYHNADERGHMPDFHEFVGDET